VGQLLRLAGAVIVTTPQDLALMDVRRGATLFRTMKARHAPLKSRRVISSNARSTAHNTAQQRHIFSMTCRLPAAEGSTCY